MTHQAPIRVNATRATLAVAGKDLRDILREKSIVAALVVQFFLAAFSTFLTVGLLGLYDPSSVDAFPEAEVAYAGPGGFDAYLREPQNLRITPMTPDLALQAFRAGDVEAVIEETYDDAEGVRTVSILVADGTIQATLALTQFKSLLADYELDLRTQRGERLEAPVLDIEVPEGRGSRVPYAFAYATLVPLLFFTPVFLSGAIAGDAFVQEIQSGTLPLLRSAPITGTRILVGKMLVPLLLAPAQVALWCGLLALNGLPVSGLPLLLVAAFVLALLLASISAALAARLRREGPVQAVYAAVVIGLALAALWLPLDPFATVARIASDGVTGQVWAVLAAWTTAAATAAVVGLRVAARGMAKA